MSYENRKEDIDALLSMEVGTNKYLNMFQSGGSRITRESEDTFSLYEITLYGITEYFHENYSKNELDELIDVVYDAFI